MLDRSTKRKMHPRNRFREGYDFTRLKSVNPSLARFVAPNAHGDLSIDYANPEAVRALNQALLQDAYGIRHWDIPDGYLSPPIPGRSDYVHAVADLLSLGEDAAIPRGASTLVLDIGTGASCVYPLIGACEYGWRFIGSEIDRVAASWAEKTVAANKAVSSLINIRHQPVRREYFLGVIRPGEFFAATICNPPFHGSAEEAAEAGLRKRRNLRGPRRADLANASNFGGQGGELWCPGGELGFIQRMIAESVSAAPQVQWFTTLVSRAAHVPRLLEVLSETPASDVRTIEMGQGQKQSRVIAWTFMGLPDGRPGGPRAQ